MVITKKDLIAIAKAFKESRPIFGEEDNSLRQWQYDIETIALTFESLNPKFRRDRWIGLINQYSPKKEE